MKHRVFCKTVEGDYHAVTNSQGQWWTGSSWTGNPEERQLYTSQEAATRDFENNELEMFKDVSHRDFEVAIDIRVYSDSGYSIDELIEYLRDAVQLEIRYDKHGAGPVEGCKTDAAINWFNLKEKKGQ